MRLCGLLLRVRLIRPGGRLLVVLAAGAALLALAPGGALAQSMTGAKGEADCNGDSTMQGALHATMPCTDIRGFAGVDNSNTWGGRFYDNGQYIGHDEPDMTFLSNRSGSGNDVSWTERIPYDPSAPPTATSPGHDVAHWFELSIAPWFSMALCNDKSYPQAPCQPESDSNAPPADCLGAVPCTGYAGGGSAFMEMQFYPPGFAPFDDAISCDNSHWCAALTIDSLECTEGFAVCNTACEEPVNFAFIQRNGVPAGPAGPLESNLQTFTPNSQTLLMNPGDVLRVHMFSAPIRGGGGGDNAGGRGHHAFEVVIQDLSTGQTGFMQASAANGFMQTTGISNGQTVTCSDSPYNFQPEYNTAQRDNIVPWAALQTNISTQFETGHWESCTGLANPQQNEVAPGVFDTFYNTCVGPYEDSAPGGDGGTSPEVSDAFCYPAGDTHGPLHTPPDTTTGCMANAYQNGDLDFDGNPYWPEWPVSPNPTSNTPGSFVQSLPTTRSGGYEQFFIQTDLALSESTCPGPPGPGCAVPPPNAPGRFYPYWSRTGGGDQASSSPGGNNGCVIEFGNVSRGVNDFGGDAQYGTDQYATYGYPEFIGPVMNNDCGGRRR